MKIAVVGAGWYGCHLTTRIMQMGHKVSLFEEGTNVFSGASRANQNRLHLGFHYPRNYETRKQSAEGYKWFKEHYPSLIEEVKNNYYLIASNYSLLDFKTYLQIMSSSGLNFEVIQDTVVPIENIDGCIKVEEMLVRNDKAAKFFSEILSSVLITNTKINLKEKNSRDIICGKYDYVLDCTWMTENKVDDLDIFYEPCIYFYYRKNEKYDYALTIMDGPFMSLYPYHSDIYTLTSVKNTPLATISLHSDARRIIDESNNLRFIEMKRTIFEDEMQTFLPNFKSSFSFLGVEFAVKTKLVSTTDFRGTIVKKNDNLLSIFAGKIDTIHVAEKIVMDHIK